MILRSWSLTGGARRALGLAILLGIAFPAPVQAGLCDLPAPPALDDFPRQPLNIFVPRGRSSGAIRLSAQIADAIGGLRDATGAPLGIEVNVLTKFGGDPVVALDWFEALPPNGYNIIQLNDTYASLVAQSGQSDAALVPINFAQIAFSQIYVRTDDPRFSDLESFVSYAASRSDDPVRIARFGTEGSRLGLEDILLDRFADTYAQTPPLPDDAAASDAPASPVPLPLAQVGYESAATRYYSLFDETLDPSRQSDALLEQPGDVAGLIESDLLRPIFTLLPEDDIAPGIDEHLGATPGFSLGAADGCPMQYRFRGFFVSQDVPTDRRRILEWIFMAAFESEQFQTINETGFVDLLYPDDAIRRAYCSADAARAFFNERIGSYGSCFRLNDGARSEGGLETGDD